MAIKAEPIHERSRSALSPSFFSHSSASFLWLHTQRKTDGPTDVSMSHWLIFNPVSLWRINGTPRRTNHTWCLPSMKILTLIWILHILSKAASWCEVMSGRGGNGSSGSFFPLSFSAVSGVNINSLGDILQLAPAQQQISRLKLKVWDLIEWIAYNHCL